METTIFVGLDVHKKTIAVATVEQRHAAPSWKDREINRPHRLVKGLPAPPLAGRSSPVTRRLGRPVSPLEAFSSRRTRPDKGALGSLGSPVHEAFPWSGGCPV
jgi:hypothetical protein